MLPLPSVVSDAEEHIQLLENKTVRRIPPVLWLANNSLWNCSCLVELVGNTISPVLAV